MAAQQVAQHLAGHAGRRPRRDVARGDQAGIGETGFFCGRAAPFENGDFVAISGQLIRGGHADDAGAHNGNFHENKGKNASIPASNGLYKLLYLK